MIRPTQRIHILVGTLRDLLHAVRALYRTQLAYTYRSREKRLVVKTRDLRLADEIKVAMRELGLKTITYIDE